MAYIIPNQQTKKLTQTNNGDISGNIFVTKNIDFDDFGKIKLSPAIVGLVRTLGTPPLSDFKVLDNIFKTSNGLWILGSRVFSVSFLELAQTITDHSGESGVPGGSPEESGVFFNGVIVISDGTGIRYSPAPWTTVSLSLTSTRPTQLCVWDAYNSLLVGNSNRVLLINTSWVTTKTLNLPSQYEVTGVAVNNNTCFIATRNRTNGNAKLFLWDGFSTAYNSSFEVDCTEIPTVIRYLTTCALITSNGKLLQFSGSGFIELGELPIEINRDEWNDDSNDHSRISFAGMVSDDDKIYIRLDSSLYGQPRFYNPYFPGGVWCFDPAIGLYCKYTPSTTRPLTNLVSASNVNTTTNEITVSLPSFVITGTPMLYMYSNSTGIGGLKPYEKIYYVIKTGSGTIKVAESFADAINGNAIDLTTQGQTGQSICFFGIYDYGWSVANNRGAIAILNNNLRSYAKSIGRVVFTANLYGSNGSSNLSTLNVAVPQLPNIGYLLTPKLESPNIEETYKDVVVKYSPLKSDDSIIIKYKDKEKLNYPLSTTDGIIQLTASWTSTSTFTTTFDMSSVEIGEEVNIIAGIGAGFSAHITNISESAGTYTVTIDEQFYQAVNGDVFEFYIDNFVKCDTITSSKQGGLNYTAIPLDKNSKFVQVKVELRGCGTTIEELQITNTKYLSGR